MFSCSYFRILVQQFEVQLQQYRQQIEELENHLATQANNSHITPQGNMLSVVIFLIVLLVVVLNCHKTVSLKVIDYIFISYKYEMLYYEWLWYNGQMSRVPRLPDYWEREILLSVCSAVFSRPWKYWCNFFYPTR